MKRDPITRAVRAEVSARSGGLCELGCGRPAVHLHHRKLRRHGDHRAVNLLHVCAIPCHAAIHADVKGSLARGWLVASWDDPSVIPVVPGEQGWLVRSTT